MSIRTDKKIITQKEIDKIEKDTSIGLFEIIKQETK